MQPAQQPMFFDTQGNLLIPGVHSPNYANGVSGWTINQDGSAEFNNIIIRGGTVEGGTALYYSGTPALGTLILSISGSAGVDPFGNAYPSGITTFQNPSGISMNILNGTFQYNNPNPGLKTSFGTVDTYSFFLGTGYPGGGAQDRSLDLDVQPGDHTFPDNQPDHQAHVYATNDNFGFTQGPAYFGATGAFVAIDPSTGGAEFWQVPVAAANWSILTLQYRRSNEGEVKYFGEIQYTGANVAGSGAAVVTTAVAAPYRPTLFSGRAACSHLTSGSIQKNVGATSQINTNGTVSIFWGSGVAGTVNDVNGLANGDKFSLSVAAPLGTLA